jgi:hypothetical protein
MQGMKIDYPPLSQLHSLQPHQEARGTGRISTGFSRAVHPLELANDLILQITRHFSSQIYCKYCIFAIHGKSNHILLLKFINNGTLPMASIFDLLVNGNGNIFVRVAGFPTVLAFKCKRNSKSNLSTMVPFSDRSLYIQHISHTPKCKSNQWIAMASSSELPLVLPDLPFLLPLLTFSYSFSS